MNVRVLPAGAESGRARRAWQRGRVRMGGSAPMCFVRHLGNPLAVRAPARAARRYEVEAARRSNSIRTLGFLLVSGRMHVRTFSHRVFSPEAPFGIEFSRSRGRYASASQRDGLRACALAITRSPARLSQRLGRGIFEPSAESHVGLVDASQPRARSLRIAKHRARAAQPGTRRGGAASRLSTVRRRVAAGSGRKWGTKPGTKPRRRRRWARRGGAGASTRAPRSCLRASPSA